MAKLSFKTGSEADYKALTEIDNYAFYYLDDVSQLYFGSIKISNSSDIAALMADVIQNKDDIAEVQETLAKLEAEESVTGSIRNIIKAYISQISNKTTETVTGENGTSQVFNAEGGGGIKYEHNDNTESFIGVSDGGENGITGQIYSTKQGVGTRINMTNDGFYYTKGSNSEYTANDELVTKKDLDGISGDASSKTVHMIEDSGEIKIYQGPDNSDMTKNTLIGTLPTDKYLADGDVVTLTYKDGHLYDDEEDVTELVMGEGGAATILDAGKYIKMVLNNVGSPLYVDVRSLVDSNLQWENF